MGQRVYALLALITFLIASSVCFPASRRTGTNEQVTSYGGAGGTDCGGGGCTYTALATWEAATDTDHVTDTETDVLECYDDAVFDDSSSLGGSTNNATYFRIVRPATGEGHDGTPGNGVRFLRVSLSNIFNLSETFVSVQDLNIAHNMNSASTRDIFVFADAAENADAVGIISFDSANAGAGTSNGITAVGDNQIIIDTLVDNNDGVYGYNLGGGSTETVRAYNCVAVNNGVGFQESGSGTNIVKNGLATGNTTDFDTGFAVGAGESENNASEDASAPGSNSNASITMANLYVASGSDDYHIQTIATTDVRDAGIDLSADGFRAFADDVDEENFDNWDIGFDEPGAAAPAGGFTRPKVMIF